MPRAPARAVVCINTESCSKEVASNLMLLPEVSKAFPSLGAYDVMAEVQGESISQLREVIIPQIQRTPKVKSTLTLTIIDDAI